jgi:hypothetical protein
MVEPGKGDFPPETSDQRVTIETLRGDAHGMITRAQTRVDQNLSVTIAGADGVERDYLIAPDGAILRTPEDYKERHGWVWILVGAVALAGGVAVVSAATGATFAVAAAFVAASFILPWIGVIIVGLLGEIRTGPLAGLAEMFSGWGSDDGDDGDS